MALLLINMEPIRADWQARPPSVHMPDDGCGRGGKARSIRLKGSADIVGKPAPISAKVAPIAHQPPASPPTPCPSATHSLGSMDGEMKWVGGWRGIFCSVHASNTKTHTILKTAKTHLARIPHTHTHTYTTGSHGPQQADTFKPVLFSPHEFARMGGVRRSHYACLL